MRIVIEIRVGVDSSRGKSLDIAKGNGLFCPHPNWIHKGDDVYDKSDACSVIQWHAAGGRGDV
jgi:hypothetical protein